MRVEQEADLLGGGAGQVGGLGLQLAELLLAISRPRRRSARARPRPCRSAIVVFGDRRWRRASTTWAGPMAMPGETPSPSNDRARASPRLASARVSSHSSSNLRSIRCDQRRRRASAWRRRSARSSISRARAGGQHHQPHDRAAGDRQCRPCAPSTSASKVLASLTNLAAARACRPRWLRMSRARTRLTAAGRRRPSDVSLAARRRAAARRR